MERLRGLSQEGDCAPFRVDGLTENFFDFNKLREDELGEGILLADVAGLREEATEFVEAEGLPIFGRGLDEAERSVAESFRVETWNDLCSEARGDGDGG